MTAGKRLRALLDRPGAVHAVGAYDGLIARAMAAEGVEALFISGNATSTALGMVDLGLTTMTEVVDYARRICDAVEIPVIVDADTGYGGPLNTRRTVRELERAGVAGLMLEDQTFPKRCGHLDGKDVVPLPAALDRLKAALDARTSSDIVIIARTDARTVEGLEAAIERGQAFAAAGADMVFVETPADIDEMKQIAGAIAAWQMTNDRVAGRYISAELADALGYKLVTTVGAVTATLYAAARDLARHVRRTGSVEGFEGPLAPRPEIDAAIGLQDMLDLSSTYNS